MQQINIEFPHLHVGQQEILRSRARFNVLACGRR